MRTAREAARTQELLPFAKQICLDLLEMLRLPLTAESIAHGWGEDAREHFLQRTSSVHTAIISGEVVGNRSLFGDMNLPIEMDNWGIDPGDPILGKATVLSRLVRALARLEAPKAVESPMPIRRSIGLAFLTWLSMVAVDLFVHAGLLARLYIQQSAFLLPPERAFALIPLGYLSFALLAVLIVWLARALHVASTRQGFLLGLKVGALIWGAFTLGLASISTAQPALLLGWFVGQTLELGIAGAVAGYGLKSASLRPLILRVVLILLASLLATIILQSLGLSPSTMVR